jgi:C1A family cysteine protease
MRMVKSLTVITLLILLGWGATASAQLTPEDITLLQERAKQEGWTFTVGDNPATRRPLSALYGLLPKPSNWRSTGRFVPVKPKAALPLSYDWRALDGCTPVRDQGYCGSCWAFGTIGPLESAILRKDRVEVDLSEQWLVSCNQSGWGCMGGLEAFDYLLETGGLTDSYGGSGAVMEADFPYEGSDVPCAGPYDHPFSIKTWAYIAGVDVIPAVDDIKQAIMDYGPVSVAMTANDAFQAYTGGDFGGPACVSGTVNHQVVLVGWDDSRGTDGAWILRNSWGTGWGEAGYMYIEYGCCDIGYGACFIEYEARDALQVSPYAGFSSVGGIHGPFSPNTQEYTLTNGGTTAINWLADNSDSWVTLSSPTSGTLINRGESVSVTVSIDSSANGLPPGSYTALVTFSNLSSAVSTIRRVRLTIEPPPFYEQPLDEDPQWIAEPGWAFGVPAGQCGDPTSGYTGSNVYGFNLDGCYPDNMQERTLTTAPINCLGYAGVKLQFWRWLGVETNWFDHASIRVSNNGYHWPTVWVNPVSDIQDEGWVKCTYDISAVADNEPTVYIQWIMGPTDYSYTYSGWNIDDIRLLGSRIDDLVVSPNRTLNASGYTGGPFNPRWAVFTLLNDTDQTLDWHIAKTQDWVTVVPNTGTLLARASAEFELALNARADALLAGTHDDTVTITNERTGIKQTRAVRLRASSPVGAGEYFTENFDTIGNDLAYTTLVLTPNGSEAFYDPCTTNSSAFPTNPASGTEISLNDDAYATVDLSGGRQVRLYGTGYTRFYVGSNGYVTFNAGDIEYRSLLQSHFRLPRISGFFDDLCPPDGGRISWQQLSDHAVVTFEEVPEFSFFGGGPTASFQIEMFFDGVVRITWLALDPPFGIAGISKGQSVPSGFVESDLTALVGCGVPEERFRFLSFPRGGWYEEGWPLRLQVLVTGTLGEAHYQWMKDGEELPGQTTNVYDIPFLTTDHEGWYTCRVTDDWVKTQHEAPLALIRVFPAGSLPVAGAAAGAIVGALCMITGAFLAVRRMKTRRHLR